MTVTEFMAAVLIFLAGFFCFRLETAFEHGKPPEKPQEQKKEEVLPFSVCRKERPSIEEQIINLALYNGEDQTGGEAE